MARICRKFWNLRGLLNNPSKRNPITLQSCNFLSQFKNHGASDNSEIPKIARSRYDIFEEKNAPVIWDIEEEQKRHITEEDQQEDVVDIFEGISPERGLTGVIDITELVDILRDEKAKDIFVATVPKEQQYVDYIVVVSGKSVRHMRALVEFIIRVYKFKRHAKDLMPKIEGAASRDWMAIDLGNIALHVFSSQARPEYDLESLWSVGKDYDELLNKPDDLMLDFIQQYPLVTEYQPLDDPSPNQRVN